MFKWKALKFKWSRRRPPYEVAKGSSASMLLNFPYSLPKWGYLNWSLTSDWEKKIDILILHTTSFCILKNSPKGIRMNQSLVLRIEMKEEAWFRKLQQAGEMDRQLGALSVLSESPGSVPSINMATLNHVKFQLLEALWVPGMDLVHIMYVQANA